MAGVDRIIGVGDGGAVGQLGQRAVLLGIDRHPRRVAQRHRHQLVALGGDHAFQIGQVLVVVRVQRAVVHALVLADVVGKLHQLDVQPLGPRLAHRDFHRHIAQAHRHAQRQRFVGARRAAAWGDGGQCRHARPDDSFHACHVAAPSLRLPRRSGGAAAKRRALWYGADRPNKQGILICLSRESGTNQGRARARQSLAIRPSASIRSFSLA